MTRLVVDRTRRAAQRRSWSGPRPHARVPSWTS